MDVRRIELLAIVGQVQRSTTELNTLIILILIIKIFYLLLKIMNFKKINK